ncbi:hypothetical protein H7347_08440 [Corynebacterium sp. zg-331]|uniref:hypothetical protein n=1 Tax=unclassified Corynebacterium TaxID=2624378 RepID=UPI00128C0689|nr:MULTISPECIES: hypothetical protein [unclassified Corynebacterium]MBC3186595.1 hypothetical protein [Corynebacterium sp. zg-331]MPV53079.1 hypothetical protein [Corynebacterium sp. zg331]
MSQTPYLLPFFSDGGGATVPVEGSSQAILFSLLGAQVAQDGFTRTAFTLLPDRASGGFLVSHDKTILGRLPRNLRDTYPQLDHIITRGGIPQVHATLSLEQGSGRISGNLYFPAPVFVMPTNFPPKEEWAMIPEGTPRPVDISRGDAQRLVDLNIPSHWLATLGIVDDVVVAIIDNRVLGVLSPEDSADIREVVEHYEMLGLVPVARVFCYDQDGQRHVVLNALSTREMSDADLEPTVSPLAPIDPYQPATGEFPIISGTPMQHAWAVTISGDQVAESIAPRPDRELRPITSPAMFALNPDGTKVLDVGHKPQTAPPAEEPVPPEKPDDPPEAPAAPATALADLVSVPARPPQEPTRPTRRVASIADVVVPAQQAMEEIEVAAPTAPPEEPIADFAPEEPEPAGDYPPLPYPHARLGEQFQEEEEEDYLDPPLPQDYALDNAWAGYLTPAQEPNEPLPEVHKVPVATGVAATPESTGALPTVPNPVDPEEEYEDDDYEDYLDDEPSIQWLPAFGVILGALSITVAALGYFKVTPDLSLDTAPAFILLGGGMLVVLGSLWFMFRPQD